MDLFAKSWRTPSLYRRCVVRYIQIENRGQTPAYIFFFFFFFLLNNFLEIYSCRVKQIFKSRLYEVCENLCVEPIDIIKYIRIQSRARWIH